MGSTGWTVQRAGFIKMHIRDLEILDLNILFKVIEMSRDHMFSKLLPRHQNIDEM